MTIQLVTASISTSPTELTRDGCKTIALITISQASPPNAFVRLPSGCLPGDSFELYWTPSSGDIPSPAIDSPSGEHFNDSDTTVGPMSSKQGVIVKKLTATRWGIVVGLTT